MLWVFSPSRLLIIFLNGNRGCMRLRFCIFFFVMCTVAVAQDQSANEIRKSIFFGGGSYYIEGEQVAELYDWLDSIPNLLEKYNIHLISHTDPIGGKAYNEWLSQMRSEAVQDVLLKKDIPEFKIHIKDWGLENAVYDNDSYAGMVMNRRVDVILYPIIF
jgi:outer membrane protein OmpA-like peptidoglycan-associated protein